jgi:(1->4)-alpha-D-glucan 1-alpha-D-glucosylmutase
MTSRDAAAAPARPESTYRLQFHAGFTFADATAIVDYLADLGVTHAYASPYLAARAGSTHGYDVIDPTRLNPEIGTPAEYDAWIDALRRRGMSHILDTVPNHMGVGTNDNGWWNDVLERGRESKYAAYFDIAWEGAHRPTIHHKVLLPVLGAPYGEVLEKGELKLAYEDGRYAVRYYDHRFPIDPATAPPNDPAATVERFNATPALLDDLLRRQHYRLAYWRVASDEINYRRFFDINDLAALAMEREDVFHAVHRFTFELLRDGKVAGLRIDHPDGLFDPKQYFERLQRKYAREILGDESRAVERPLYVVAEKILAIGEPLPESWPCHGTSGYDFLIMANGLFVDSANADAFTRIYDEWTGEHVDFEDLIYEKKKLILQISLASELNMLAHQLDRLAQSDSRTQDFTLNGLHVALREVIACFPVYRSYVTKAGVHESDVRNTELAVRRAIERNPKSDPSAFRFVGDVVLLRSALGDRDDVVHFAGKFQQLTAPTTAKGIEDTAFYIYNRLVSLNEVGGEPHHFGTPPDAMHDYLATRQRLWPHALSAMSTHDTKRSEDVRARINVLSEIPDEWREHVTHWGERNAPLRREVDGKPAPNRNDEYLLYQTLIGAWPLEPDTVDETFVNRIRTYMTKALREAKLLSSWTSPNEAYEGAATDFVAKVIAHRPFLDDFLPFQAKVARFGLINSLAQTLLRLAAPGVPDTYQGQELWDFSLVDPDNRRPVDYARRRELLESTRNTTDGRALPERMSDGRMKLFITRRVLTLRREHPGLFTTGTYEPLHARGAKAAHAFAFARRQGDRTAIAIVPRLPATLGDEWGDTSIALPRGTWRNVFNGASLDVTGGATPLAPLLGGLPVALLIHG